MQLETMFTQALDAAGLPTRGDLAADIARSFAGKASEREAMGTARAAAAAVVAGDDLGEPVTNRQVRTAWLAGAVVDATGRVECPGCKAMGHTTRVAQGNLETRHLPWLKRYGDVGGRTPATLLRVGCRVCNSDDGDACRPNARQCGTTCCTEPTNER